MLHITLVYAPTARTTYEVQLEMPEGSCVDEVFKAASAQPGFEDLNVAEIQIGIWGYKATKSQLLRDRDRVEIYRPLKVNPKVARRERFAKQGARKTGLFAKRKS